VSGANSCHRGMWLRALAGCPGRVVPAVMLRYPCALTSLSSEVRPPRVWAVVEVFEELHDLIGARHARAALAWTARKGATYRRVRGCPWRAVGSLLATIRRMPRRADVWRTLLGCLAESAIPLLRRRYTASRASSRF
jgi:hypothetical protein